MFTSKDFKVELINKEDVKTYIKRHGRFASICYNTDEKYAEKVGESCLSSGHLSGSRHLCFEFKITHTPRSEADQMARQEQGVNKNVQSFRYVAKNDIDIYVAPELEELSEILNQIQELERHIGEVYNNIQVTLKEKLNLTNEECNEIARTVLPIGQAMSYNIAFNIEGLMRLVNVRLCNRAEYPIRTVSKMMIDEVIKAEPRYKPYLVPQCIKLGKCPEGKHTCGKLKEMEKLYK